MPRIIPIQLLKCLKVLLHKKGGILSESEVKRIASLMTKYSKKLVSKCVYVQILKASETELLGEFMGVGGWSLVYTWLHDAIRGLNWPLVQEILELLLLSPVDVHRLKINSAPKLVKGLCKDGGNERVRILAKRLVEQWLKVVTDNPEATLPNTAVVPASPTAAAMTPHASTMLKTPSVAMIAPNITSSSSANVAQPICASNATQLQQQQPVQNAIQIVKIQQATPTTQTVEDDDVIEQDDAEDQEGDEEERDPLGDVQEPVIAYSLTPAQRKASESGLVYKIVVKNGNQFLAKVPKSPVAMQPNVIAASQTTEAKEPNNAADINEDEDVEDGDESNAMDNQMCADDNSSSLEKPDGGNSSNDDESVSSKSKSEDKKSNDKKIDDKEKSKNLSSTKDKDRRSNSSMEKEKDKSAKSSSSSHKSSSHKTSSSSKSSSSSSSSSKSKSSSSSSSHRSSSDKDRKDRSSSSSSKDKDRSSSSSSSKHKSSSSSSSSSSSKSSSSSSSSSKDKSRDKDKSSSSSSSSKSRDKEREDLNASLTDKTGKTVKKTKEENEADATTPKPTSITIPCKKASISIEIRKDTEKAKTVKTYKSQFRSHGLTEEAPPPPSRKGLKKPSSAIPSAGAILPISLPSAIKRSSPPRDSPTEKKPKIDIINISSVPNEKPGAIKLIPPKKIQTLVETNLFSDALSAATGPKKVTKRKRLNSAAQANAASPPASPAETPKVMALKFYQDTLDESKGDESKADKENEGALSPSKKSAEEKDVTVADKDIEMDDDDDDIPLKKVKEDIEQRVAQERKKDAADSGIEDKEDSSTKDSPSTEDEEPEVVEVKPPGPGCGPNGPPGVLMLHRRKGPKKKLTWRPQESLEQIRYFEMDENERVNVTKTSFLDMKNLERFSERDAIVMARRGFNQEDNMEPQTTWKALIEVDDVPPHPDGSQSKQRKVQDAREKTTLRALYFTLSMIPDSPAEAELEPSFTQDVPLIPLEDLTGNPDAVNDFTSMPWPEPRGSPKQGESGSGGLGSPVNMFGSPGPQLMPPTNNNVINKMGNAAPFGNFMNQFPGNQGINQGPPNGPVPNMMPNNQPNWQRHNNNAAPNGPMMSNPFIGNHGSPLIDMIAGGRPMGGGPGGGVGPNHMMNNGPPQNFNNPNFNNNFGPSGPSPFGPPMNPFGGSPSGHNFGQMGPGPMMPPQMMNGMGPGPMMGNNGPMMNGPPNNNRNNGGNWRNNGPNFQDNGNGNSWRPAGSGPNNRGVGGGNGNNNNGVCKAFMRGHCRLGKSCKFIHPSKNKRI